MRETGTFRYGSQSFPLSGSGCTIHVEISTTFRRTSALVLHAEADSAGLAEFDGHILTGLMSFDLEPPVSWRDLPGRRFAAADPAGDGDDSVYIGIHRFSSRAGLEFFERDGARLLLEAHWHLEDGPGPVSVRGWFTFGGALVRANDKIFGARLRALGTTHGRDDIPDDDMAAFDRDLVAAAEAVLETFAVDRAAEYGPPGHASWNVRRSGWNLCRFPPR